MRTRLPSQGSVPDPDRKPVRHSAAQESQLAAEELRSWLAALALDPGRISLRNDLQPSEPLRLEVIRD